MLRLRWNNQNQLQARHQTSVFQWREGWMARTYPRPRWREKNVLDIPFYRSGDYTQNPSMIVIGMFQQLSESDTRIDDDCVRPGLVSRLRLVCANASASRGPSARLDRAGSCAGLRYTPHREFLLRTLAPSNEASSRTCDGHFAMCRSALRWQSFVTALNRATMVAFRSA